MERGRAVGEEDVGVGRDGVFPGISVSILLVIVLVVPAGILERPVAVLRGARAAVDFEPSWSCLSCSIAKRDLKSNGAIFQMDNRSPIHIHRLYFLSCTIPSLSLSFSLSSTSPIKTHLMIPRNNHLPPIRQAIKPLDLRLQLLPRPRQGQIPRVEKYIPIR